MSDGQADGEPTTFFELTPQGLRVRIRLTPSGRRDGVDGVMVDAHGNGVLKASVTKAPEDGKANQALIKMLAKEWKMAKSAIDVIQGQTSRTKVLLVTGDAATLQKHIGAWASDLGQRPGAKIKALPKGEFGT